MVELVLALARPRVRILLPPRRYFRASDVRPPSLREPDPLEHPNPPPKVQVPKRLHSFAPVVGAPRRKKVGDATKGVQFTMICCCLVAPWPARSRHSQPNREACLTQPAIPQDNMPPNKQVNHQSTNHSTSKRIYTIAGHYFAKGAGGMRGAP